MPKIVVMQTGRDVKSPMVQVGNTIDISKSKSVEETMDKVKKWNEKRVDYKVLYEKIKNHNERLIKQNEYCKHLVKGRKELNEFGKIWSEEIIGKMIHPLYFSSSNPVYTPHEIVGGLMCRVDKLEDQNEKLKEEKSLLNKKNTELKIQNISMKKSLETIKKHNEDIEELKKPITNKDTRCPPFNVKVNVNYILELMEIKRDEIDFDDYELWDGFDEQVKERLMIELANCIDGYINEYCTKPSHQLWNEYLVEEFCGDVDRLLQDDYFSQYIKYEENDDGEWKYTPIKQED
jgi:hypothetical protein